MQQVRIMNNDIPRLRRYTDLLRHLHNHPEPSVSALARALGRQYRRVHADVAALEQAGLLDRSGGEVRTTADRISAEINL